MPRAGTDMSTEKVAHSSSRRGRTCAARGRAGTALRGFLVAAPKLALLFGNTPV